MTTTDTTRAPLQIVLLLDLAADNPLPVDDVLARVPAGQDREVIRATECGGRPEPRGAPTDWDGCADAVGRMAERAHDLIPQDGRPYRFFIAGRAALPVFVHLGSLLSRWSMHITLLNQRQDATWDVIALDGDAGEPYFDIEGIDGPSLDATGYVSVVVSCELNVTKEQALQFARGHGGAFAGMAIAHARGKALDASFGPRAAQQLAELMTKVKTKYPNASGVHLFVAGPATLAFMAGRAMNVNVIPEAWVANFTGGAYELALVLPRNSRSERDLDRSPEREEVRGKELAALRAAILDLQATLQLDDVPLPQAADRDRFIAQLRYLTVAEQPKGDDFDLSVHEGTLSLGRGLLDALVAPGDATAARIVQLIVLHEVFHERQNLESTNFFGIGRAGYALEEVDYAADAFAAETLIRWNVRRHNTAVGEIAPQIIRAVLVGIEAFDRFEQGPRIERLAERRLRRYLIWHLQHVRAMTVRTVVDVGELLAARLVAELAPLVSYLDGRFEKIVRKVLPTSELFIALGGVLARTAPSVAFIPVQLVEGIRTYELDAIASAIKLVRDTHKQLLIPWALR